MSDTLHMDIESYNELDLSAVGVYKYAEHPSAEILTIQYRFDNGPVTVWVPRESLPQNVVDGFNALVNLDAKYPVGGKLLVQPHLPEEIRAHVKAGKRVAAHNANFERIVLNGVAGKKINFPRLTIEQMHCTAAKARAHGLPGKLEQVAKALGTHPKNEAGKGVMLQCTRPKKPTKKDPATRYTPENAPDKFICLYVYGADDVYAECGVDEAVPNLPPKEVEVWRLTERMNDKGVYVDRESVENIRFLIAEYRKELYQQCLDLTWNFETDEGIEPRKENERDGECLEQQNDEHPEAAEVLVAQPAKIGLLAEERAHGRAADHGNQDLCVEREAECGRRLVGIRGCGWLLRLIGNGHFRSTTNLVDTRCSVVGAKGFEPSTPASRTQCATGLRYAPTGCL